MRECAFCLDMTLRGVKSKNKVWWDVWNVRTKFRKSLIFSRKNGRSSKSWQQIQKIASVYRLLSAVLFVIIFWGHFEGFSSNIHQVQRCIHTAEIVLVPSSQQFWNIQRSKIKFLLSNNQWRPYSEFLFLEIALVSDQHCK